MTNGLRRISPVLFGLDDVLFSLAICLSYLRDVAERKIDSRVVARKNFWQFSSSVYVVVFYLRNTAFYLHRDDIDSKLLFLFVAALFATLMCLVITKHSSYKLDLYML